MAGRYGLEVRGATAADAPAIAELLAAAGRPSPPRALAERIEALRVQGSVVLIATAWGPPSGLVVLHHRRILLAERAEAEIELLLVHPDERRTGLGRLLLKAASRAARTAGCAELRMAAAGSRDNLRAFCLATGFLEIGSVFARPLLKRRAGED